MYLRASDPPAYYLSPSQLHKPPQLIQNFFFRPPRFRFLFNSPLVERTGKVTPFPSIEALDPCFFPLQMMDLSSDRKIAFLKPEGFAPN